jgi:hypothetical protein
MEEAPENSKESSHSARANGMNEWVQSDTLRYISLKHIQLIRIFAVGSNKLQNIRKKGVSTNIKNRSKACILYAQN